MIKIEKGIPIPNERLKRPDIYPFAEMNIGDSFFVPDVPKTFYIHSYVRDFNSKHSKSIRIMQRRENDGVRVWRIK